MNNKDFTIDIFNRLKGQFVLMDNKVFRFIGIGENQDDFLYILWDGKEIYYKTILEHMIQLKDKINKKDYDTLISRSKLNDYDNLIFVVEKIDEKINEKSKISNIVKKLKMNVLTDINKDNVNLLDNLYWTIN